MPEGEAQRRREKKKRIKNLQAHEREGEKGKNDYWEVTEQIDFRRVNALSVKVSVQDECVVKRVEGEAKSQKEILFRTTLDIITIKPPSGIFWLLYHSCQNM